MISSAPFFTAFPAKLCPSKSKPEIQINTEFDLQFRESVSIDEKSKSFLRFQILRNRLFFSSSETMS